MQTIIKNNSSLFDTESIREQVNIMQQDYMNTNLHILQATVKDLTSTIPSEETRDYLLDDVIYDLLIWDSSEEPLPKNHIEYLNQVFDYSDYAGDNDCIPNNVGIEMISESDKLYHIHLVLHF